jgi:hypothetical protein
MTQIAIIATQIASPGNVGGTSALAGNPTGLFGGAGMSFMDMIFASSLVTPAQTAILKTPGAPMTPVVDTMKPAMTAAQALAATKAVASGLSQSDISLIAADLTAAGIDPAGLQEMLVEMSEGAVTATDTIIMTEQSGETAAGALTTAQPPVPLSPEHLGEVMKALRSMIHALPEASKPKDTIVNPALIATPMNPAELTKMIEELVAQVKAGKNTGIPGMVNLVPVKITTTNDGNTTENAENVIAFGMVAALPAQDNTKPIGSSIEVVDGEGSIDLMADIAAGAKPATPVLNGGYVPNAAMNGANTQNNSQGNPGAGGSSVPAHASGMGALTDSLMNSAGWDSIYPDGLEWTQHGHTGGGQSLSVTGTTQFASLVSHAQNATAPHPATQMVAAQITKGAVEGETKSMTLKLDPPELGRVEIRMDFAKEKGMKAHIVVEKQETYLMLQRDVHVLERALQDAGISAENGGLSFELAQDNLFNDGHNGSNRHGGGAGSDAATDGEEIIETTVNWSVDAETGMTRYNILA